MTSTMYDDAQAVVACAERALARLPPTRTPRTIDYLALLVGLCRLPFPVSASSYHVGIVYGALCALRRRESACAPPDRLVAVAEHVAQQIQGQVPVPVPAWHDVQERLVQVQECLDDEDETAKSRRMAVALHACVTAWACVRAMLLRLHHDAHDDLTQVAHALDRVLELLVTLYIAWHPCVPVPSTSTSSLVKAGYGDDGDDVHMNGRHTAVGDPTGPGPRPVGALHQTRLTSMFRPVGARPSAVEEVLGRDVLAVPARTRTRIDPVRPTRLCELTRSVERTPAMSMACVGFRSVLHGAQRMYESVCFALTECPDYIRYVMHTQHAYKNVLGRRARKFMDALIMLREARRTVQGNVWHGGPGATTAEYASVPPQLSMLLDRGSLPAPRTMCHAFDTVQTFIPGNLTLAQTTDVSQVRNYAPDTTSPQDRKLTNPFRFVYVESVAAHVWTVDHIFRLPAARKLHRDAQGGRAYTDIWRWVFGWSDAQMPTQYVRLADLFAQRLQHDDATRPAKRSKVVSGGDGGSDAADIIESTNGAFLVYPQYLACVRAEDKGLVQCPLDLDFVETDNTAPVRTRPYRLSLLVRANGDVLKRFPTPSAAAMYYATDGRTTYWSADTHLMCTPLDVVFIVYEHVS